MPDAANEKSRCHLVGIPLTHLTPSKTKQNKNVKRKEFPGVVYTPGKRSARITVC